MSAVDEDPPAAAEATDRPKPYLHDAALVPVLAQLADAACQGAGDPHAAAWQVKQGAVQTDPPVDLSARLVLFHTFMYSLYYEDFPQAGTTLGPVNGPSFLPTALRDSTKDVRELWLALADQVTHPTAQARVLDIVFTLRLMPNNRDSAKQAARAYLDAVGGDQRPELQASGLVRAWTLARSVGLADLEQESIEVMLHMVEDLLNRNEHANAVTHLLCALVTPRRAQSTEDIGPQVDVLLDRALYGYVRTDILQGIVAVVRKRAADDPARVEDANRILINAMLADAESAVDPLVISAHLWDAASEAQRWNIKDLEDIAVTRLQSAPEVDWQSSESSFTVPAPLFELYLPGFEQAETWQEALNIWLNTSAPSGSLRTNSAITRAVLKESVILQLATTLMFREDNLPARKLNGESQIFLKELAHVEARGMNTNGLILAWGLHQIRLRFGVPPHNQLSEFIGTTGTHPDFARALATALQLYWVGQFDACIHMAAPKVEPATRSILLKLNEPIYKTAVGDASGLFPGLSVLLDRLEQCGLNQDWLRFLRTFLLNDGQNVRNHVAHGYLNNAGPVTAALALRATTFLTLLATAEATESDSAAVSAALDHPLGVRPQRSLWKRLIAAMWAARRELIK